ncbi:MULTISPECIES: PhzF family phenazine biosynthesis protein [unclassified Amycolatopsis]|uniref:PhzF family phenazine biosynthesis protein n=1 Tax=unclassified Amycolatopsis TaxID=2618356 RepID=UPI00287B8BAE|nr:MULTISPECIES: PhzF family phenazine biosynthesis protein [unclassified Amycolatopsis]
MWFAAPPLLRDAPVTESEVHALAAGLRVGPHPAGSDAQFEVRAFTDEGTRWEEDPVTGSLNAAIAQWLIPAGGAPSRYTATQGAALQRRGRIRRHRAVEALSKTVPALPSRTAVMVSVHSGGWPRVPRRPTRRRGRRAAARSAPSGPGGPNRLRSPCRNQT